MFYLLPFSSRLRHVFRPHKFISLLSLLKHTTQTDTRYTLSVYLTFAYFISKNKIYFAAAVTTSLHTAISAA
jgi:hypothetical protein